MSGVENESRGAPHAARPAATVVPALLAGAVRRAARSGNALSARAVAIAGTRFARFAGVARAVAAIDLSSAVTELTPLAHGATTAIERGAASVGYRAAIGVQVRARSARSSPVRR